MPTEHRENCSSCGTGVQAERNHYFTGKFMTAGDFETDQNYQVSRHRLHNRLLHGWGIICGLEVRKNKNPDCEKRWVLVSPGSAIDCCGRELFVEHELAFELPLPRAHAVGQPADPDEMHGPFLLGLAYEETCIDFVPALYAENACDTQRTQPNHLREGVKLVYVPLGMVDDACWLTQGSRTYTFTMDEKYAEALEGHHLSEALRAEFARRGLELAQEARVETLRAHQHWEVESQEHHFEIFHENHVLNVYREQPTICRSDCDAEEHGGSCLGVTCACQGMVPLALVTFDTAHPDAGFHLSFEGRKHLAASGDLLTHIVQTNWPHGGALSLHRLREHKGQLRIRFDRKLLHHQGYRSGINALTFIVQYGGEQRELEFMPSEEPPHLDDEGCVAVFTIDEDYFTGEPRKGKYTIANNWVYITLKCDFIMDCHYTPVDGNHLRGQLPSGDGVPGGTFESWFWVGDDAPEQGGEEHEIHLPGQYNEKA